MPLRSKDGIWIWHPDWVEGADRTSAGGFVHFRKSIKVHSIPAEPVRIRITADTKYKLYINARQVLAGPVKGDEHLWFYDEVDIRPYFQIGTNYFSVRVLRFYHASPYATSFPRLPYAGLLIRNVDEHSHLNFSIQSDDSWETALDKTTRLPVDIKEDDFLHVYETVDKRKISGLVWVHAKPLAFPSSHGLSAPWKLSPSLIPSPQLKRNGFTAINNITSTISTADWEDIFLIGGDGTDTPTIFLPAGTTHHLELEVDHHMTAWLDFRFKRPMHGGSTFRVTYSECYEDTPEFVPYVRRKGNRRDKTKKLIGPVDQYVFGGKASTAVTQLHYHEDEREEEIFSPFHFRTLRFIALDIAVAASSDLIMRGIDLTETHYPLQVLAKIDVGSSKEAASYHDLFNTSVQTLKNCMHDCYEDCPFYEQLQYAMDVRSSAIFTYCISADDRLARQAIIQLHNTFSPSLGLIASRAPSHQNQIIPHFALFWICMVVDHFTYFNDASFVRQFLPVCDGIFETFARRIDPELALIRGLDPSATQWDFVDWTESWKPMGIPPAAEGTGYQTYTNSLYAYSLKLCAGLLNKIGRPALASEYKSRAAAVVQAIKMHCFNGKCFTDGLASMKGTYNDLSQTNQVWAVLCGAASDVQAQQIIQLCISSEDFAPASTAMSFYLLRALSMVGGEVYTKAFHSFWDPWRQQMSQGMTTWLEDNVSQRSECHAWGSAPLHEFMAEVAGIRPSLPGWEAITFEPRINLFPSLDAMVPFHTKNEPAIAHVNWCEDGEGFKKVSLSLKLVSAHPFAIPVHVKLPDGQRQVITVTDEAAHTFLISIKMSSNG
jgi:hypothetical protein